MQRKNSFSGSGEPLKIKPLTVKLYLAIKTTIKGLPMTEIPTHENPQNPKTHPKLPWDPGRINDQWRDLWNYNLCQISPLIFTAESAQISKKQTQTQFLA